ncbi:MAG: hypothetical protein KDA59_07815, partial [Planctomycetales bacterium]|nr:hypothetical protein [Planctomycetales bacterium]
LVAAWGAQEDARAARTRAQIVKLHELIMNRWESYRTRPVPIRIPPTAVAGQAASVRLAALRQMMRRELPERITDIDDLPTTTTFNVAVQPAGTLPATLPASSLWRTYRRRVAATYSIPLNWNTSTSGFNWTTTHQGSECLYMILATMRDGDTNALDFLQTGEIGDVDEDGMPEILDAWGNPIWFLRWAPGFRSEIQKGDGDPTTDGNAGSWADPFDLLHADPRWSDGNPGNDPYILFPLIYSAGRDEDLDVMINPYSIPNVDYSDSSQAASGITNDPYLVENVASPGPQVGWAGDVDADGYDGSQDNIYNHTLAY